MKDNIIVRSLYIEESVYNALKEHCKENGLTVTGIIRVLIKKYLEEDGMKVCVCCGKMKSTGLHYSGVFLCTDCFKELDDIYNGGEKGGTEDGRTQDVC